MQQMILLERAKKEEFEVLKQEIEAAFLKGLHDQFPQHENPAQIAPVPSATDIEQLLLAKDAVIYRFVFNETNVGGAVLKLNDLTKRHVVQFFYINASAHSPGIGTKAWQAIEEAHPDTLVWELFTPYFEKRNIHFYVNKCGFHIVEFRHKGNPGPNTVVDEAMPDAEYEFFRFEKVMGN